MSGLELLLGPMITVADKLGGAMFSYYIRPKIQVSSEATTESFRTSDGVERNRLYKIGVGNLGKETAENCRIHILLEGTYYPYHPEQQNALEFQIESHLGWMGDYQTQIAINSQNTVQVDILQLREGEDGWRLAFPSENGWDSYAPVVVSTDNEEGNFTQGGDPVPDLDEHRGYMSVDEETGEPEAADEVTLHENLFKEATDWDSKIIEITSSNADTVIYEIIFNWEDSSLNLEFQEQ